MPIEINIIIGHSTRIQHKGITFELSYGALPFALINNFTKANRRCSVSSSEWLGLSFWYFVSDDEVDNIIEASECSSRQKKRLLLYFPFIDPMGT